MCVWVVAWLPQRLKSASSEKFLHFSLSPKAQDKISKKKTLILAFKANSALSCQITVLAHCAAYEN